VLKPLIVVFVAAASMLFTSTARAADLKLEARAAAAGTSAKGKAAYEERGPIQQRFKVEVQNAVPGTQFPVLIGGKAITTLTANSLGRAEVELRVGGDDVAKAVKSLPRITAGMTVRVGPLTGTFQPR
jgi:hypothetical protein